MCVLRSLQQAFYVPMKQLANEVRAKLWTNATDRAVLRKYAPWRLVYDEQYRSDQPALLMYALWIGWVLGVWCCWDGAAWCATNKFQVVSILNRRWTADNCARYLLYNFASLNIFACSCIISHLWIYLPANHFCTCVGILVLIWV